jgi:hypothetical protein
MAGFCLLGLEVGGMSIHPIIELQWEVAMATIVRFTRITAALAELLRGLYVVLRLTLAIWSLFC